MTGGIAHLLQLAQAEAEGIDLPWTPALAALVSYGLQSPDFAAFTRLGRLSLTPSTRRAEAQAYFRAWLRSYVAGRQERLILREVGTVADPAIDVILTTFADIQDEHTLALGRQLHRQAMAAENLLGALLERYLARELEPQGWVWCAGNTIRAVDFIRQDLQVALQIKNRSNSENSSSSAIRAGTDIRKWFRVHAQSGRTNWTNFPAELPQPLSEADFHDFIRTYPLTIE